MRTQTEDFEDYKRRRADHGTLGIPRAVMQRSHPWLRTLLISVTSVVMLGGICIMWNGQNTHDLDFAKALRIAGDATQPEENRCNAQMRLYVLMKSGLATLRENVSVEGKIGQDAQIALRKLGAQ